MSMSRGDLDYHSWSKTMTKLFIAAIKKITGDGTEYSYSCDFFSCTRV